VDKATGLKNLGKFVAVQMVLPLAVEIPHVAVFKIDLVHGHSRLYVSELVRGTRRIGQVERIKFYEDWSPFADLLFNVVHQAVPRIHFLDVETEQHQQIRVRELEERPLIPFEVDPERKRESRDRLESHGM